MTTLRIMIDVVDGEAERSATCDIEWDGTPGAMLPAIAAGTREALRRLRVYSRDHRLRSVVITGSVPSAPAAPAVKFR